MKKFLYLLPAVLVMAGLSCKKEPAKPFLHDGFINMVSGEVYIISGEKKFRAGYDDRLKKGMIIETGKKSMVDIEFSEDCSIRIMENNTIGVDTIISNLASVPVNRDYIIKSGKLYNSPTTISSVRAKKADVVSGSKEYKIEDIKGDDKKNGR